MSGLATLVIGVGGTGLTVLQYVKERLFETYAGQIPPHINLLAFDAAPSSQAAPTGGVALTTEPTVAREGASPRPAELQLLLPSPVFTMQDAMREARSGSARWAWLEVDKLAPLLPGNTPLPASRPCGRMQLQINYQQIRKALQQVLSYHHATINAMATDQTSAYIQQHTRQNIFLVGSLAGSMGGGLLLDLAVLLRSLGSPEPYRLIGMVALPSCFAGYVDTSGRRLANSYAALRELDRFMRGHTAATPATISLPDGTTTHLDNMLFDLCYLVDAQDHSGIARAAHAGTGALAAMADAIVTHIDLHCGLQLNAAYSNVPAQYHHPKDSEQSGEAYHYQPRRLYSALNSHAVIFPREDVIQSLSLRFLLELLDDHLIQRATFTGGLAVPNTPIKTRDLIDFLSKYNSAYNAEIATMKGELDIGVFLRTLLRYSAQPNSSYSTASVDLLAWLVEDEPQRRTIQTLRDRSLQELTRPVNDKRALPGYSQRAQGWITRYLASLEDTRLPLRQARGEWSQALATLPQVMRTTLHARVHALLLRLLNQREVATLGTERSTVLRANRLGYALDVLRTLKERVRLFKRQTQASFEKYTHVQERMRQQWRRLHADFITLDPDVPLFRHNPGPDYLNQLRELAEVEWHCLVYRCLQDVLDHLGGTPDADGTLSILDSAIHAVEAWATTFATVREHLAATQKRHTIQRQAKQLLKTRAYITDPAQFPAATQVEERLYAACRARLWRAFLGTGDTQGMGMEWVPTRGAPGEYTLIIRNPKREASPDVDQDAAIEVAQDAPTLAALWQRYTLRLVAELIRQDQQARVAGHITTLVPNAQTFVQRWLQPHRRALIRLHTIRPNPQQEEHYLAVDPTSDDRTVTTFYSWIETNWQQTGQQYIQAESEVACSFLTLYHGLELTHVAGFVESAAAYRNLLQRGESLHLLLEEQHAAAYESRMPTLATPDWQAVHCLHPQIVVCLHPPAHVRAFALALVAGLLTAHRGEQSEEYLLQVPGHPALRLAASATIVGYPQLSRRPLDRQAALLLQAFQTFTLRGHALDEQEIVIPYAAILPAFQHWLATTHGSLSLAARMTLVRAWETDQAESQLYPLLYAESHDPRFRDLGIVLLLELYAWAEAAPAAAPEAG